MSKTVAKRLAGMLENQVYFGSYDWERVEPMMIKAASLLRRQEALIERQRELLRQALSSLKELVPDPQIDFGPAYEGTKQRQKQVIAAIRNHLEVK